MTTPVPATGAGDAAPDTGSAPDPSTATDPQQTPGTDVTDWQAEAEKWQKLARKHEERSKANLKAYNDAKTAGQPKDGEPSAEDIQRQLTEANEAREAAESRAAELVYNSTVMRVAAKVNADPEALLDSGSFLNAVQAELGDDFDDDDLTQAVTKVAKEYAKNSRFSAQTGPPRAGADMTGGTPPPPPKRPTSLVEALKRRS